MTKTLYLIDGSGFIFRAYHALPGLTNPQGVPVGAVYGFVNMVLKLKEEHQGDYFAVIFDAGRKTFRNAIYPEYKAHRPPPPDDLIPQFKLVRDATEALNLPAIEMADFEADDIIAAYAHQAEKQGIDVTIVSSDKDLMQLINPHVRMYDAMKQKSIGDAEVMEKFGVAPHKVLDVLSLIGDSSDNVPGVPGIGPKTAAELIGQFGDLETLLSRAGEIKQNKRRETLLANIEQAKLSKELITLKHDIPLPLPIEELAMRQPAPQKLIDFLHSHGFKTLTARLQAKLQASGGEVIVPKTVAPVPAPATPADAPNIRYSTVSDEATLESWIERARKEGHVAFDTETTSLNPMQAELVGFSLSIHPSEACYVPLLHRTPGEIVETPAMDLFSAAPAQPTLLPGQIPQQRALQMLKLLLEDESILKIGHNIKYDILVMRRYGIETRAIDDSMLMSYVLHAGEHGPGMDELSERYLNHKTITYDEVTGTGKKRLRFDEVDIEKATAYAAEDADITLRLYQFFKPQLLSEKLLSVYNSIERPLITVLADMEAAGIKVDCPRLQSLSADFATRMGEYEREIIALAGHPFNVGSPKQLGEVLFDEMGLPGGKKSAKTGAYATDSGVLEELAEQGHKLPGKVLEWRQLAKLKSTYTDALNEQIDPGTKRVHTNYAMASTSTGRLSSSDPNLQNIPIRTNEGKKIRQAFVAEQGYKLLSADYSQIELRLLAHMANIPTLQTAFRNGDDIHAITASQMFGVPVSEVNADLRRSAKTINFGIIYGISAHGLAVRLGIGRSEAAAYIERYFAQYPGIRDYMEQAKTYAREHGYVTTLFGRRCHMPGIADKNGARRQFYERAAINAPLQGTAADIIKRAMVSIHRDLPNSKTLRMLLQVHDELVFEVPESETAAAKLLVTKHMEEAAELSIPLTVETGIGDHWGEAH